MIQRFVMLVGVAGSGKSTYATRFKYCLCDKEEEAEVFSSDEVRAELFGDASDQQNPALVFKTLNARCLAHLAAGHTAIYDATNLIAKRRVEFLKEVRAVAPNCETWVIVCDTPTEICIKRQALRDRVVPNAVIERQGRQLEFPDRREGWDFVYCCPMSIR